MMKVERVKNARRSIFLVYVLEKNVAIRITKGLKSFGTFLIDLSGRQTRTRISLLAAIELIEKLQKANFKMSCELDGVALEIDEALLALKKMWMAHAVMARQSWDSYRAEKIAEIKEKKSNEREVEEILTEIKTKDEVKESSEQKKPDRESAIIAHMLEERAKRGKDKEKIRSVTPHDLKQFIQRSDLAWKTELEIQKEFGLVDGKSKVEKVWTEEEKLALKRLEEEQEKHRKEMEKKKEEEDRLYREKIEREKKEAHERKIEANRRAKLLNDIINESITEESVEKEERKE